MQSSTPVLIIVLVHLAMVSWCQNAVPTILQSAASIDPASQSLTVTYIFADPDSEAWEVSLLLSDDGGATFDVATDLSGDIGPVLDDTGTKVVTGTYATATVDDLLIRLVIDDLEPIDIQSIVDQVDSSRLRQRMLSIEGVRHKTAGLDHLLATRALLEGHLQSLGYLDASYSFDDAGFAARNVIALQPGLRLPEEEYLVGGHYDTVDDSPGADDNGTAVAALMEVAEILSPYILGRSIRYVAWDLEEVGLVGSSDYVGNQVPMQSSEIVGYLNFEMIGYASDEPNSQRLPAGFDLLFPAVFAELTANQFRGDFLTNVGNQTTSKNLAEDFEVIGETYVPDLNIITVLSPDGGLLVPDLLRSDHAAFWLRDLPAVMLTDGAEFRNTNYHSPADRVETLDFDFFSKCVKASVAYLAEMAEVQHVAFADMDRSTIIVDTERPVTVGAIRMYPNPATDLLTIELPSPAAAEALSWSLSTIAGQMVIHGDLAEGVDVWSISLADVPAGVYIMSVETSSSTHVKQVIIE